MSNRYDVGDLKTRISEKLTAYARQAEGYRVSTIPNAAWLIRRGSLAAVIPLAASANVLGQCITSPSGDVTLNGGNPFTAIKVGTGPGESVGINWNGGFVDLLLTAPHPIGIIAFSSAPAGPFPVRYTTSASIQALAQYYVNSEAYMCYSGTVGDFCAGASGFIGLRRLDDARFGWIYLAVNSLDGSGANLSIGARGFKLGSGAVHAGDCSDLPVELVHFDAVVTDHDVALSWETASELNNAGFEVQRAAPNEDFRKVAFVEGSGTATDPQTYSFRDDTVEPNAHYRYRLRQIDLDGTTSLSQIVEVFTEDPSQIALSELYPNPVSGDHASLRVNLANVAEAAINLFDVRGAIVLSISKMLDAGENRLRLDTSKLSTGAHFAKIQIGERVMYRKFVVTK